MKPLLLNIENLHVDYGETRAVKGLDLSIHENETLALVGESGSGKSVTALSILRLIEKEGGYISQGRITLHGEQEVDLAELTDRQMCSIRGRDIAMVFQEPLTALNPVMSIGSQLMEALRKHKAVGQGAARKFALDALARVNLPSTEITLSRYPHELSGGQRQRVLIAIALAGNPRLLIADEPSTALDVTTQREILALIRRLQQETGMSVLFITHDMGVVTEMAHRVVVMRQGIKVEEAAASQLLRNPCHSYTRMLLTAAPRLGGGNQLVSALQGTSLEVKNLVTTYKSQSLNPFSAKTEKTAVNDVSLYINRGETLGLVGESGCGKSSLARSIVGLAPVKSGQILIEGEDISGYSKRQLFPIRRQVQMIFQDPYASMNPRLPVWDIITEPAYIHGMVRQQDRKALASELLSQVALQEDQLSRYPHQFSGGQRQRLSIARALSSKPTLIIADEPVSALDASIAQQVGELLRELQANMGLSFLFISHDMAVIERMSHRIAVMLDGSIIETGTAEAVLNKPQQDYTRKLIDSVPRVELMTA